MIKKEIAVIAGIAAVIVILIVAFFVPSCEPEPDRPRSKYVVFSYSGGHEEYRVSGGGTETVEFEYDARKEYSFKYEVFYSDNDSFTGESGSVYGSIKANKPGTYNVFAHFKYNGMEAHSILKVIIKEKPLITPEVRFDPNGATVEERDGETIYVYDYDGKDHFPMIQVFYENEQIELDLYNDGIVSIELNGEFYRYHRPREIGRYRIEYWVYGDDYVNEEDLDRFRGTKATIIVEIRG